MDTEPTLTVDNLHFSYGNRPLLEGISLRLKPGQISALLGGSGSGKTTVLRLISGQLQASSGNIRFRGEEVSELDYAGRLAMRRRMGMLFQFGALFTDLSVYENIAFPMREHYALPEYMIHDLVTMKLYAVGLQGVAHQMPFELSGGMARRVALARAIALDPMLMLYDEPFTGLDPISLGTIARLIHALNDALQIASLIITHNIAATLKIADYAYLLSKGKIVAEGTPQQLQQTQDPFVRQFIDGIPEGPETLKAAFNDYTAELGLGKV